MRSQFAAQNCLPGRMGAGWPHCFLCTVLPALWTVCSARCNLHWLLHTVCSVLCALRAALCAPQLSERQTKGKAPPLQHNTARISALLITIKFFPPLHNRQQDTQDRRTTWPECDLSQTPTAGPPSPVRSAASPSGWSERLPCCKRADLCTGACWLAT